MLNSAIALGRLAQALVPMMTVLTVGEFVANQLVIVLGPQPQAHVQPVTVLTVGQTVAAMLLPQVQVHLQPQHLPQLLHQDLQLL